MSEMMVVRAGIPTKDNCPILTRLSAYVVSQGVPNVLEHVFRNRKGMPVDLTEQLAYPVSEQSAVSDSLSEPYTGHSQVMLRVKEWLGAGTASTNNPVWTMYGNGYNADQGIVRVQLERAVVDRPGIYELSWAIVDPNETPLLINQSILSVERSLFYHQLDISQAYRNLGPPTLGEFRMLLMDSSANENLLLDEVEFDDEQILLAIVEPVRYWNEIPPPIETYTTRNFPYRGAWASGTLGRLHLMAANHYRRNHLVHQAGGIMVADKAKAQEYSAEGQRLWQEYQLWCQSKKIERNLKKFCGNHGSQYSARAGW